MIRESNTEWNNNFIERVQKLLCYNATKFEMINKNKFKIGSSTEYFESRIIIDDILA